MKRTAKQAVDFSSWAQRSFGRSELIRRMRGFNRGTVGRGGGLVRGDEGRFRRLMSLPWGALEFGGRMT